jgi:hypothetical protein
VVHVHQWALHELQRSEPNVERMAWTSTPDSKTSRVRPGVERKRALTARADARLSAAGKGAVCMAG